jgi:cell division protein FtsQ
MNKLKKALRISLWLSGFMALIITMGFVAGNQKSRTCSKINILISDEDRNSFVDASDVLDMLNSKGKKLTGTPMQDINTGMLEKIVNTNPFIENAEVFSTIDGIVNITVSQRTPVIRIMNASNEDYYMDESGVFMPVSEKYTAPVIVANGYIFNTYAEKKIYNLDYNPSDTMSGRLMLEQLYTLANVIRRDTFWNAQVEQLYVNEWQEIEMIPRLGNHRIILGDISNLDDKLGRLMAFYRKGLNKIGWNTYRTINLKFKNQVVCSKN